MDTYYPRINKRRGSERSWCALHLRKCLRQPPVNETKGLFRNGTAKCHYKFLMPICGFEFRLPAWTADRYPRNYNRILALIILLFIINK
jgi:hypothetical protein